MPYVQFEIHDDGNVFSRKDSDFIEVGPTPESTFPVDELAQRARDLLEIAWKRNRRYRHLIESCTVVLPLDDAVLKFRAGLEIVTVHQSKDFVYVHPIATCSNCGWRDNASPFASEASLFYCSSYDCQNKRRELEEAAFISELEADHRLGQCGFNPYYQPKCTQPSVSEIEPFCALHTGMKCTNCDKQAVGEQGWSGSFNYFHPFCEDHWFTLKRW